MASRSVAPLHGERTPTPFTSLQREMNRLFEDFFPARGAQPGFFAPEIDVSETDKEIRIAVDLPGVDQKDVDVTLDDDVLTIRGEKRSERKEEKENYHFSERSFGSFQRALRLPLRVDAAKIKADFDNGVLKVTVPKDGVIAPQGHKIAIGNGGGETPKS